jgi:hypothetical protein
MHTPKLIAALVGMVMTGAPAAVAEEACFVSYEAFERDVPHVDLESCLDPATAGDDEVFCRLSLNGDAVYIYTFRHFGRDSCLEAVKKFSFEDFKNKYGTSYHLD